MGNIQRSKHRQQLNRMHPCASLLPTASSSSCSSLPAGLFLLVIRAVWRIAAFLPQLSTEVAALTLQPLSMQSTIYTNSTTNRPSYWETCVARGVRSEESISKENNRNHDTLSSYAQLLHHFLLFLLLTVLNTLVAMDQWTLQPLPHGSNQHSRNHRPHHCQSFPDGKLPEEWQASFAYNSPIITHINPPTLFFPFALVFAFASSLSLSLFSSKCEHWELSQLYGAITSPRVLSFGFGRLLLRLLLWKIHQDSGGLAFFWIPHLLKESATRPVAQQIQTGVGTVVGCPLRWCCWWCCWWCWWWLLALLWCA